MLSDRALALLTKHWRANRTPVSDANSALVADLATTMESPLVNVKSVPSGSQVLDWQIPEWWGLDRAVLRNPHGEIIADSDETPVAVWAHSIPFEGEVSWEGLKKHILTDPTRPGRRVWHYKNIYRSMVRDWGFSVPHRLWKCQPQEGNYTVTIKSELAKKSSLDYVDTLVDRGGKGTVLFCAHTCHPGQVADGLGNCLLLMDLHNELSSRLKLKHNYRFIFGPETFTAAAVLAQERPNVVGVVYVDMLAAPTPLIWQQPLENEAEINSFMRAALNKEGVPYRKVWGNDERFYSARPWVIETVTLARGFFPGYHTDADRPKNCPVASWEEGAKALRDIVDVFERNCAPKMNHEGPLYLTKHGLYDDCWTREETEAVELLQVRADSQSWLYEIAIEAGVPFRFIADVYKKFKEKGLAE